MLNLFRRCVLKNVVFLFISPPLDKAKCDGDSMYLIIRCFDVEGFHGAVAASWAKSKHSTDRPSEQGHENCEI